MKPNNSPKTCTQTASLTPPEPGLKNPKRLTHNVYTSQRHRGQPQRLQGGITCRDSNLMECTKTSHSCIEELIELFMSTPSVQSLPPMDDSGKYRIHPGDSQDAMNAQLEMIITHHLYSLFNPQSMLVLSDGRCKDSPRKTQGQCLSCGDIMATP